MKSIFNTCLTFVVFVFKRSDKQSLKHIFLITEYDCICDKKQTEESVWGNYYSIYTAM